MLDSYGEVNLNRMVAVMRENLLLSADLDPGPLFSAPVE